MSSRGRRDSDSDQALFEQAMREVEPLGASGPEVEAELLRRKAAKPGAVDQSRLRRPAGGLRVEFDGESALGMAPGVDRKQLRRLRRGHWPIEMEIDLHGFSQKEARAWVRSELEKASRRRCRCVRIIHGRGHGSQAGPVLKKALPGWLVEMPSQIGVLAFSPASAQWGGAGATLVLLK